MVKEINLPLLSFDTKEKKSTFKGKWTLKKDFNEIDIIELNISPHNLTIDILGQGIFENKPPWTLFIYISDPDLLERYEFRKIK